MFEKVREAIERNQLEEARELVSKAKELSGKELTDLLHFILDNQLDQVCLGLGGELVEKGASLLEERTMVRRLKSGRNSSLPSNKKLNALNKLITNKKDSATKKARNF